MRRRIAGAREVGDEKPLLYVAVALAVAPIAEEAIAEFVAEQGDDAVLRGAFRLSNLSHGNRVFPVKSSCIMPCLISLALASFSLQRGDLGVHVGEDGGYGGLLGERRKVQLEASRTFAINARLATSHRQKSAQFQYRDVLVKPANKHWMEFHDLSIFALIKKPANTSFPSATS